MRKPSNYDPVQISQMKFDDEICADRVTLVGGEGLNISASIDSKELGKSIADNIKLDNNSNKEVQVINVPQIIVEHKVERVEIPTIITERVIERIEIPVIIKEIEYKEIPIPIVTRELEIKEVHIPVVTQEVKVIEVYRDRFSTLEKYLLASQTLAMIFVAISYLIKGH